MFLFLYIFSYYSIQHSAFSIQHSAFSIIQHLRRTEPSPSILHAGDADTG
jgi:hypothetical protein